ncbi:MAG: hypothetical protein MZV64_28805 [Ignavibacteriales bacterium]|nr:hypothetical protein [Ignavibacteriales bacterium]
MTPKAGSGISSSCSCCSSSSSPSPPTWPRSSEGRLFPTSPPIFPSPQSLAHDGDLRYDRADIIRIREQFWGGPTGIFLTKAKDGRLLFRQVVRLPPGRGALYRLFGTHGILLANGLMIFFVLLMGFLLLRQHHRAATKLFLHPASTCFPASPSSTSGGSPPTCSTFSSISPACSSCFTSSKGRSWNAWPGCFSPWPYFPSPTTSCTSASCSCCSSIRRTGSKFLATALVCLLVLSGLLYFNYAQTGTHQLTWAGSDGLSTAISPWSVPTSRSPAAFP